MDERNPKQVIISHLSDVDLQEIFIYGIEVFGALVAIEYLNYLKMAIRKLTILYLMHPECRHLPTKQRIYRNIITDTHLVIYRICENRIEVLRILHASSSIGAIKKVRGIKI